MTEEKKEPTLYDKLQLEFNQACNRYGYLRAQVLLYDQESIEELFGKISKRAQNIKKSDIPETKIEETLNGTEIKPSQS